jgi:hypothetical protein
MPPTYWVRWRTSTMASSHRWASMIHSSPISTCYKTFVWDSFINAYSILSGSLSISLELTRSRLSAEWQPNIIWRPITLDQPFSLTHVASATKLKHNCYHSPISNRCTSTRSLTQNTQNITIIYWKTITAIFQLWLLTNEKPSDLWTLEWKIKVWSSSSTWTNSRKRTWFRYKKSYNRVSPRILRGMPRSLNRLKLRKIIFHHPMTFRKSGFQSWHHRQTYPWKTKENSANLCLMSPTRSHSNYRTFRRVARQHLNRVRRSSIKRSKRPSTTLTWTSSYRFRARKYKVKHNFM